MRMQLIGSPGIAASLEDFIMRGNAAHKLDQQPLDVAVVERRDAPGVWTVEAIDNVGDGSIFQAIFQGPQALERAQEYASFKYGL